MGTNIFFFVDIRQPDGTWQAHDRFTCGHDEDGPCIDCDTRLYDGRNSTLFTILGYGRASHASKAGIVPVSPARGIPDDATPQYRQFAAEWGEDGHSHSYLTLRELLDYDWTHHVRLEGWLNLGEWVTWTGNNRAKAPDTYCAGIIGRSIRHVSTGTMEKLLERYHALSPGQERASFLAENADTYAQATWHIPAYAAIDYFWAETVPVLLHIARGTSGLDRVRIVFFFNN